MGGTNLAWLCWVFMLWILHGVNSSTVPNTGNLGAVASESKTCSDIGTQLIRRGGNAADAMVGTTLCVGVIGMYHSGIGGGGFMLVRSPDGEFETIDYRETAPAAAYRDMYKKKPREAVVGGNAVAVPGDLRGLEYLHKKYGQLPWHAVCNPAIHVARYGFPVTEDTVYYMKAVYNQVGWNFLQDDPNWAMDFAPNGTLLKVGDTMTRKRFANTLEKIADKGASAFYEGEIAEATIAAIKSTNGIMTLADLQNYEVKIRNPINITYRGYTLHSTGTPSGGSIALSILKTIEGYDMYTASDLLLNTHRLDESMRFSYAAHSELGDPSIFAEMDKLEEGIISPETASANRRKILDDKTQDVGRYNPEMWDIKNNHGTSHMVATDASGLSITSTSTVNLLFGSAVMVPETGVILNNEMDDFSIPGVPNSFGFVPSPMNYVRPGARPMSSISPIHISHPNGSHFLSIGAAGGSRIPTSTIQTIINIIDHGMSLEEALKQPRLHDQLLPERTTVEPGYSEELQEGLRERGHKVTWSSGRESAVQGVRVWGDLSMDDGLEVGGWLEAVGEPRQKGSGGSGV
ncbi:542ee6ce-5439-4df9-815e-cd030745262e [Sclerotinia trifoliorum]|uniref:Glutathione hydrolase n=1 Tax=Sclerotinia trifoliorum TaxID=28548 RepID=A0A8H2VWC0_9HELO|nr:542ee6ce-5439-4df9-815e-cd030745262e [Sclerotinia trifoliorum]